MSVTHVAVVGHLSSAAVLENGNYHRRLAGVSLPSFLAVNVGILTLNSLGRRIRDKRSSYIIKKRMLKNNKRDEASRRERRCKRKRVRFIRRDAKTNAKRLGRLVRSHQNIRFLCCQGYGERPLFPKHILMLEPFRTSLIVYDPAAFSKLLCCQNRSYNPIYCNELSTRSTENSSESTNAL